MSMINVSNLTFAYDGSYENVFENVNFQIDTDWKLGFIGRNGRGKTTFLNLLQSNYEYKGKISSNVVFEYFPYNVQNKELLTSDIINKISYDYQQWELIRELNLLQVSENVLYRPFNTLSSGEQTKVLLAALFLKENSFLLIDEPTNHLDITARKIVGDYLNSKSGFILVSHDRNFLDRCIDHILSINKTNIEIQKGNFSSWYFNKEARDNFERNENEKLKKEIKRLSKAAKRTSEWSYKAEKAKFAANSSGLKPDRGYIGHKAAKMMAHSTQIKERQKNAVTEKSKLLKDIETVDNLKISPLKYYANRLLIVDKLLIKYDENIVCKDISFQINQGERIALCGKNGSGKSSILKLLYGFDIQYSGEIIKNNQLRMSYVSQDTSYLRGNLKDYARENDIDESLFKTILQKLDFSRAQFEKDIADFSGGQKKKVLIAGSLCNQAHLYIWDEPLNFIDVFSRMQIEQLLLTFEPTILFVEHDEQFQKNIMTKMIKI